MYELAVVDACFLLWLCGVIAGRTDEVTEVFGAEDETATRALFYGFDVDSRADRFAVEGVDAIVGGQTVFV